MAMPQFTLEACPLLDGQFMFLFGASVRKATFWMALALAMAPGLSPAQGPAQTQLQRIKIGAGMHLIDTQLALTPEQRQIGLMWRKDLPVNEGMLFVFEQASVQCFWMRNTLTALTAAFVEDDGTIVNLADMKPQSDDSHCSTKPVRFVLEMNQGWFKKRGIAAGFKLTGQAFKP
jgi:uncharacterized membrane protein (UPF0127 family)